MLEHIRVNTLTRQKIEKYAKELGFDLVGFSPAKIQQHYVEAFKDWIEDGNEGEMEYMKKIKERADLTKILPGAKSVIVLAMNYYYEQEPLKEGQARVARYAYGRDYHKIITKKLKELQKFIEENEPDSKNKRYVDTGPVIERALAEQSGIGSIGKNSCFITKEFGSWVFLSEIITTLDLLSLEQIDQENSTKTPKITQGICGTCTKCIDACPTGAIIAPGVIDSRLCISYLTIENKEKIPAKLAKKIAKTRCLYGCDICQEVCPHNCRQKPHSHPELSDPKIAGDQLDLKKIQELKTDDAYLKTFAGSPLMRAKRKGLQRNANIVR